MVSQLLISIMSGVVTALVLAVGRQVARVSKTVTESAAAAATLTATVASLQTENSENRERIAALWARVFPVVTPSSPPWSSNAAGQPQRARTY